MKILLFGCEGRLGWELQRALAPLGPVVALDRDSQVHAADFHHPDAIAATVRAVAPEVIVNAAAYTDVDRAEREPELAHRINAQAPEALADAAARCGAWLVHYSTDYVFDDAGPQARDESAPAHPLSVYGHSKLAGERAVRARCPRHLVLRTGWLHAMRGPHFADAILRQAMQRPSLKVVADQIGAPTGADLVADVTAHMLRTAIQADEGRAGTYHVVAGGHTSWHAYARHVLARAQTRGWPLRTVPDAVVPITTTELAAAARRPLNSRLDTRKLQAVFGLHLPDWRIGADRMLDELLRDAPPAAATDDTP